MRWSCSALGLLVVLWAAASTADEPHLPWWRTAIFYQVYPRSFKDGDGDGVGDLRGIAQKADYFKEIGVHAIWLSPILKSPMADFGYDISDFTMIDPIFGTMDDFDALVDKLNSIGVKLVMDFVPNHTSDEHEWFQMSVNTSHPLHQDYRDFYVWREAKGFTPEGKPIPPNNWISIFSGSSWTWREERQQFYYHNFVKKQPDLNYRCPNVVSNMTAILKFWLDKGVDGFRMDAVKFIFEDKNFPNAPPVQGTAGNTYDTLQHIYDTDQPETFKLVKSWADLVYQRVQQDGRNRAIFLEVYDNMNITMKYFGSNNESLEFPFNFVLLGGRHNSRPSDMKRLIDLWMSSMPAGRVPNWVVGNHDNGRVSNRYGSDMVDAINLLTGVLPGIKITYYGEEIGMKDTYIRWDQTVDPAGLLLGPDHYLAGSRDPGRTPFQWDNSTSSGFSTNVNTWLPVSPNYWWLNVDAQRTARNSHLKVFQAMADARRDPVLQRGDLQVLVPNNDTLVVIRSYNESFFALVINMGSTIYTHTSANMFGSLGLDSDLTVVTASINSGYYPGVKLQKGWLSVTLRPKAAVLLRSGDWPPSSSSAAHLLIASSLLLSTLLFSLNTLSLCR